MQLPSFQQYLGEMANVMGNQERGICQICGREQAVRDRGNITHHGYTRKEGWFQGVCPGQQHKPLQHDKSETERQIAAIKRELPKIEETIAKLQSGKLYPLEVSTGRSVRDANGKRVQEMIKWEDAPTYHREPAVKLAIWNQERRLRSGKDTITYLEQLIVQYHGQELKVVDKSIIKPTIQVGSKIKDGKDVVVVTKIEDKRCQGVGPGLNGQYLPHCYWTDSKGRERSWPKRLCRLAKE